MSEAKAIFGQALAIDSPEDCAAYLEQACGGNAMLLAEVKRLVATHAKAGDFLKKPAVIAVDVATPAPNQLLPSLTPTAYGAEPDIPPELQEEYECVEELGRGGMGIVYRAKHKRMGRLTALKVINKEIVAKPRMVERFIQEIRSAARLTPHPNIVTAFDAPKFGDLLVFAMEYVEGTDLQRLVTGVGPLPIVDACFYTQEAAKGLQHAFEHGLVHRDLKPANLLLTRGGNRPVVKISDFGLAKVSQENEAKSEKLTETGTVMGSPEFCAPEQLRDAATAGIQADIYSLGCTLYFLLTGRPPFRGNLYELMRQHDSIQPTPLNEVRKDIPADLAAVVAKMMAKDPTQRFQQPINVVQALAPFIDSELLTVPSFPNGGVAPQSGGKETLPPLNCATLPEQPRKKRLPLVAVGVAGLLVSVFALWATGVLRVKTPEGVLVIETNVEKPEVLVDGKWVAVNWGQDGKTAEIRIKPGTYKVEVKKSGFTTVGEEVELYDGKQRILKVTVEKQKPPPPQETDRVTVTADSTAGYSDVETLTIVVVAQKGWMGTLIKVEEEKDFWLIRLDNHPEQEVWISSRWLKK